MQLKLTLFDSLPCNTRSDSVESSEELDNAISESNSALKSFNLSTITGITLRRTPFVKDSMVDVISDSCLFIIKGTINSCSETESTQTE